MRITDREMLAQEGFTAIRNLLAGRVEGGSDLALKLSQALHNIPVGNNENDERFTAQKIVEVIESNTRFPHIRTLLNFIDTDSSTSRLAS
ncbi:TPA: hypothetical protein RUZ02_002537 [Vibrio cholerae]|nr:hypothetical protein [Vibrio cholerae]